MAPELLESKEFNDKSDFWSIGMLYYFMLFGKKYLIFNFFLFFSLKPINFLFYFLFFILIKKKISKKL